MIGSLLVTVSSAVSYLFSFVPSWTNLLLLFVLVEVSFYLVFVHILTPRADRLGTPAEYRDYGRDRHSLFLRVARRIDRASKLTGKDPREGLRDFLASWFCPIETTDEHHPGSVLPVPSPTDASLGSDGSDDALLRKGHRGIPNQHRNANDVNTHEMSSNKADGPPSFIDTKGICREEADDFFAWAFFAKHLEDLESWELGEISKMHNTLREQYGIVFPPGRANAYKTRRLTLESCQPMHRPFLLYTMFYSIGTVGGMYLRFIGFRRYTTSSGVVYWHRRGTNADKRLPLLFFHGIAPAGKTFYIPMVLSALGGRDRCVFFFENPNISNRFGFDGVSEDETVWGVGEAIDRHVDQHTPVCIGGHSFGSCPMTWLLRSQLRNRIRQYVLLDPVTIALSEPDVMINFLYARLEKPKNSSPIDVMAGSELFTIHYLRRHFAWYNSELWLEDLPDDAQVLICLAECDEIISTLTVRQEIDMMPPKNLELIHWDGVGHAHCITSASTWPEIREKTLAQEQKVWSSLATGTTMTTSTTGAAVAATATMSGAGHSKDD